MKTILFSKLIYHQFLIRKPQDQEIKILFLTSVQSVATGPQMKYSDSRLNFIPSFLRNKNVPHLLSGSGQGVK